MIAFQPLLKGDLKINKIFLFIIVTFLCFTSVFAQDDKIGFTPDGRMDKVFDSKGNAYNLADIYIPGSKAINIPNQDKSLNVDCGYFRLFFDDLSGFEVVNNPVHQVRRDILCQVFTDISNFIESPLTGSPQKVNIWVKNIEDLVVNSSNSDVAGVASSFYNVAFEDEVGHGEFADHEIYKTIISGVDSYSNVTLPIVTLNGNSQNSGVFYHGLVAINFNSGINWYTDLSLTQPTAGTIDLYSVCLHEITHALGFASLINVDGNSFFGADYNYYSRYDSFLKYNNQNVITSTNGNCHSYGLNNNLGLSILNPCAANTSYPSNHTTCSDAIYYSGSVTVPVYTPDCYEKGSSLSHFEDQCYVPLPLVAPQNDLYYAMSNGTGSGSNYFKRYLKPEERKVFCDLGYTVNNTFGSTVNQNYFNYATSMCSNVNVAGFHDGINFGTYTYMGFNNITIPLFGTNGILMNDKFNGVQDLNATITCVREVNGDGLEVINVTGTNIFYNSPTPGIHLLSYIPVSSNGIAKGSPTYIFVFIDNSAGCPENACNMIGNGSFEQHSRCGFGHDIPAIITDCWYPFCGSYDIYELTCTYPGQFGASISNLTSNCSFYGEGAVGTYNNAANNRSIVKLGSYINNGGDYFNEGMMTRLITPILANHTYKLGVWVSRGSDFHPEATLLISGTPAFVSPISQYFSSNPTGVTILGQIPTQLSSYCGWEYRELTFTSPINLSYIQITNISSYIHNNINSGIIFIDEVSLTEVNQNQSSNLNLPDEMCVSDAPITLNNYQLFPYTSAQFFGDGVTENQGVYEFNPATNGIGSQTISYTYTNSLGCSINESIIIEVGGPSSISLTASSSNVCEFQPVQITASGADTYTISPSGSTPFDGDVVEVIPASNTIYTVTGINTYGCSSSQQITISTFDCSCPNCNEIGSNGVISGSFINNAYCINNNVYINTPVMLTNCVVKMAPYIKITIGPNGSFTGRGVHFYGCSQMWQGFEVESGGNLILANNGGQTSLVEDAIIAVNYLGSSSLFGTLKCSNTTFNKNREGIKISNLNANTGNYPINIEGCVFTCRDLPFLSNGFGWSYTQTLKTLVNTSSPNPLRIQYIDEISYSSSNANSKLKAPFAGTKSKYAIHIINSGYTVGETSNNPVFKMLTIGIANVNLNVFDNHLRHINLVNSNVNIRAGVFQNTLTDNTVTEKGYGVYAVSEGSRKNSLTIGTSTTFANEFNNCHNAVKTLGYFDQKINNNIFRSTQIDPGGAAPNNHRGSIGVWITSHFFKKLDINTNTFYNIEKAVIAEANAGTVVYNNQEFYFQNTGDLSILSNTFKLQYDGFAVANLQYMNDAIIVNNILNNFTANPLGNNTVNISSNAMFDLVRGITVSGWKNKLVTVRSNTVSLKLSTNPNAKHVGISFVNNASTLNQYNKVQENIITGFQNSQFNPRTKGINYENSKRTKVCGNQVSKTYQGLSFNGFSPNTKTKLNSMDIHRYGFVLDNEAIIGVQGTANFPTDNIYVVPSSWNTTNSFKTAVLNNSTAQNSKMYVRSSGSVVYNPNGSSSYVDATGTPYFDNYFYFSNLPASTLIPFTFFGNQNCNQFNMPQQNPTELIDDQLIYKELIQESIKFKVNPKEKYHDALLATYTILKLNPKLYADDEFLETFVKDTENKNIGLIFDIEQEMSSGNKESAKSYLGSFIPQNQIEENQKKFFELYLKTKEMLLNEDDTKELEKIATLCPYTGGEVVYKARTLMNYLFDYQYEFEDKCDGSSNDKTNQNTNIGEDDLRDKIIVYPNPSNGIVFLELAEDNPVSLIKIMDKQGRVIPFELIQVENGICQIKLQAQSGIYFIETAINGKLVREKIVIHN